MDLEAAPAVGVGGLFSQTEMSPFARSVYEQKYAWKDDDGNVVEDWEDTAFRVASNVLGALGLYNGNHAAPDEEIQIVARLIAERKFIPGGRYLYASGRGLHQTQNCLLLRAEDSREGWADLWRKAGMALMTGAGIGIDYSDIRPSGSPIKRTGGFASGPIALMKVVNEIGRGVMQGGARRSAIWAGLNWNHGDIFDFIRIKDWTEEDRERKSRDFNYPMTMEFTNVSVLLDDEFFEAYNNESHELHAHANQVYWLAVRKMISTAEPGFSVDIGEDAGETLRNACTEVTSRDSDDICNLGSINLGRIESIEEMRHVVKYATLFLLAGTVYSDLPYDEVEKIRFKNRRLGLGVMGVHEWLLKRGKPYGPDAELAEWMHVYEESDRHADEWAREYHLTTPVKTRAIAPTGTIGIIGETTTGIEPIYCVAYKRRLREAKANGQDKVTYQYVIDPTAKRLVDEGVDPDTIEDAYMLSYDVERRVEMQAWMQQFVDHGISSTINLPYPITDPVEVVEFGNMLMKHLPNVRGITVYPNGARAGQPYEPVAYEVAASNVGVTFEESEERCASGGCGI
jgi:ribonucleoside-diphosphate reductase alpha chain